jgi:uncharacterized protein
MAGTKAGAAKAVATIRARKGPNFYAEIGAKGGRNGKTGGFAAGEEGRARARKYGAIGGRISRRGKRADGAAQSDYDLAA